MRPCIATLLGVLHEAMHRYRSNVLHEAMQRYLSPAQSR
jgi:hypothetical protein